MTQFPSGSHPTNADAAIRWALENVRPGSPFHNRDTDWSILVSRTGIGEAANNPDNAPRWLHFLALTVLPLLIERAVLAESFPDKRGNPEILAMHRMYAPAEHAGILYRVKLTIKEYKDGRRFYNQRLTEIERAPDGGPRSPDAIETGHPSSISEGVGTALPAGPSISIDQLLKGATMEDGRPFDRSVP